MKTISALQNMENSSLLLERIIVCISLRMHSYLGDFYSIKRKEHRHFGFWILIEYPQQKRYDLTNLKSGIELAVKLENCIDYQDIWLFGPIEEFQQESIQYVKYVVLEIVVFEVETDKETCL